MPGPMSSLALIKDAMHVFDKRTLELVKTLRW